MFIEIMRQKVSTLKYYKTPILVFFSFILGCTLTLNLIPIDKTCGIETLDKGYNIMQNSRFKNPDLVILILSAPKNLHRRNAIRKTWLQFVDSTPEDESVKFKMKHYFVIGSLGLSADDILHLSTEQSQFSDILILPMHDTYQNLAEKVLRSFEWLNSLFGQSFKYVLKCDDDSFVRADKLHSALTYLENEYIQPGIGKNLLDNSSLGYISVNTQSNSELELYWGYFNGNAKVKSTGKWKEPNWIVCDRYVPYALGGGYILSQKLVTFIAKNKDYLRVYNSEDVSVGVWLTPVKNILRVHDIRFDTEWSSRGCQDYYLVSHNLTPDDMQKIYTNILNQNKLCSKNVLNRKPYHYNWTLPPSQCCRE